MAAVKIVTNKPGAAPKAVEYADMKKATARGMGAAKRGGSYLSC